MATATTTTRPEQTLKVERLDLEGMTCASCAARIEKKLNRLDGVEATVNFATEQATVHCDTDVPVERLVAAVESAGYGAHPARPAHEARAHDQPGGHQHHDEPLRVLTRRLIVAVVLTVPVALMAMLPPLRFAGWEWLALVLSTPVVFYSGIGFHRAALRNARHLAATMDTLISLGTVSAWLWSTVVLVGGIATDTYFEVSAVVTTLIVLGRYLEARAKGRSSEAIRKLLELGAKETRLLRDGREVARPRRPSCRSETCSSSAPARRSPPTASSSTAPRRSTSRCSPVKACRSRSQVGVGRRRRDREHLWAADRACDQGRGRHRARADRTAGRGGPVRQGAGAAARRPCLGGVRADRDRPLAADAGRLARLRRLGRDRLHRCRRRPDHRLPVRARSGDADGADGRHRPRRADRGS